MSTPAKVGPPFFLSSFFPLAYASVCGVGGNGLDGTRVINTLREKKKCLYHVIIHFFSGIFFFLVKALYFQL